MAKEAIAGLRTLVEEHSAEFAVPYYDQEAAAEHLERRQNVWKDSDIVKEQQARLDAGLPVRIAILDNDSTWFAGDPAMTNLATQALRDKGFSRVQLTARPTELQMRWKTFYNSRIHGGLRRPMTRMGTKTFVGADIPQHMQDQNWGKADGDTRTIQVFDFPEDQPNMPEGFMDSEVMGGANATQLAVRNGDTFYMDQEINERYVGHEAEWRRDVSRIVKMINLGKEASGEPAAVKFSDIDVPKEDENTYYKRRREHDSHDLKIAIHPDGPEGKKELRRVFKDLQDPDVFIRLAEKVRTHYPELPWIGELDDFDRVNALHDLFLDLDMFDDSNPDKMKSGLPAPEYVMHLVPKGSGKEYSADHVVEKVAANLQVRTAGVENTQPFDKKDMQVLIAGDSLHDFKMGMEAAKGAQVAFVVAGGSRMFKYLTEGISDFGGEDLSPMLNELTLLSEPSEAGKPYHYQFSVDGESRDIYVYTTDRKGPEAILAAVSDFYQ